MVPARGQSLVFGAIAPRPFIPGIPAVTADVPPVLRRAKADTLQTSAVKSTYAGATSPIDWEAMRWIVMGA
jgi:hypothetical protein